jgi:hypothetical protein
MQTSGADALSETSGMRAAIPGRIIAPPRLAGKPWRGERLRAGAAAAKRR